MFVIHISSEFKKACPDFVGAAIYATVQNSEHNDSLWREIDAFIKELVSSTRVEDIKLQPAIAATREGYKRCGKDPGRYRPSAEALRRRLVRGLSLYQIDTLVDVVNLVSLRSGYSIGGFDVDKIQGESLELGIGRIGEIYEGIGRGILNIDGLPVYRDSIGGIGTPTSDNERTKLNMRTKHILTIINGYNGLNNLSAAVGLMKELLIKYASATEITIDLFK